MVVYVEMVANQVRIGFESARLWLAALPATFCCDLFACYVGAARGCWRLRFAQVGGFCFLGREQKYGLAAIRPFSQIE